MQRYIGATKQAYSGTSLNPELSFREWLLREFRWFGMDSPVTIALPDRRGMEIDVSVQYIDPRFENYKPVGILEDPRTGRTTKVPYNTMCQNGGTGWEASLPFARNLFLIYDPKEPYGKIGPSEGFPRLPDDWFAEAEFSDEDGRVVYYAKEGIFNTPDPRLVRA